MGRAIARKAIDGDHPSAEELNGTLQPGDGFGDEGTRELFANGEVPDRLPSLDEGSTADEALPQYSLDDFPVPELNFSSDSEELPENTPPKEDSPGTNPGWRQYVGRLPKTGWKKGCLVACSVLLVVSGVGVTVRQLNKKPVISRKPVKQVIRAIKRPITIPQFQEQMQLFLFANTENEKNVVALDVTFNFPAENAYQEFQKNIVLYRDLAYQFVKNERPKRNSHRVWQEIVEKDLLKYLQSNFPNSGLHSIQMGHWARL